MVNFSLVGPLLHGGEGKKAEEGGGIPFPSMLINVADSAFNLGLSNSVDWGAGEHG